jgi:hypothetical protein
MTDEKFWDLIALIDWRHEPDEEKMLRLLRVGLEREDPGEIESFQSILTEKLQALDTPVRYKAAKEPSGDCFLYLRLYVVGRGRAFYAHVGSVSRWMPHPEKWLEGLLYVARKVYLAKTGHELPEPHGVNHESFSSDAWK